MKKDKILHFENFNHANHVNYFEKKKKLQKHPSLTSDWVPNTPLKYTTFSLLQLGDVIAFTNSNVYYMWNSQN